MNSSLNCIIIFITNKEVNNLISPPSQTFSSCLCSCILSTFLASQKQEMGKEKNQISWFFYQNSWLNNYRLIMPGNLKIPEKSQMWHRSFRFLSARQILVYFSADVGNKAQLQHKPKWYNLTPLLRMKQQRQPPTGRVIKVLVKKKIF